jgi:hypothetical protein
MIPQSRARVPAQHRALRPGSPPSFLLKPFFLRLASVFRLSPHAISFFGFDLFRVSVCCSSFPAEIFTASKISFSICHLFFVPPASVIFLLPPSVPAQSVLVSSSRGSRCRLCLASVAGRRTHPPLDSLARDFLPPVWVSFGRARPPANRAKASFIEFVPALSFLRPTPRPRLAFLIPSCASASVRVLIFLRCRALRSSFWSGRRLRRAFCSSSCGLRTQCRSDLVFSCSEHVSSVFVSRSPSAFRCLDLDLSSRVNFWFSVQHFRRFSAMFVFPGEGYCRWIPVMVSSHRIKGPSFL